MITLSYCVRRWGNCRAAMTSLVASVLQGKKSAFYVIILSLLCYFLMMDAVLYVSFQSVNLIDEKATDGQSWSPFHPLSVRLLMVDHCIHYITTPISENFEYITGFSNIFYVITPNMITFTHLTIGLIAGRLVSSEYLRNRRIGVVLFELRMFLDAFDGTLYRSRANDKIYASISNNFGFWIDSTADIIANFSLCFGVVVYLWKCLPYSDNNRPPPLTNTENGGIAEPYGVRNAKRVSMDTKASVLWLVVCYGVAIVVSFSAWEYQLYQYSDVFLTRLDADRSLLQSQAQHSNGTWVIFWLWKLIMGDSLHQILLAAVLVDNVWELLRFTKYVLLPVVCILATISYLHVQNIRVALGLTSTVM